jgi:hypothetical protein
MTIRSFFIFLPHFWNSLGNICCAFALLLTPRHFDSSHRPVTGSSIPLPASGTRQPNPYSRGLTKNELSELTGGRLIFSAKVLSDSPLTERHSYGVRL